MVRAPSDSFYCSLVLGELCDWLVAVLVPYHKFVIIATAGKLLAVVGPLESAHFLLVAHVLVSYAIFDPKITTND